MSTAINEKNAMDTSSKIKWSLTILIAIAIMLIPTNEQFTNEIRLFFAITITGILLLAFELTHIFVPAILLPLGYFLFELAPLKVVFGSWTTQAPWLLIGSLIIAEIMDKCGLSKRVAYFCMLKAGGRFKALMMAMMIAGMILAAIVPAALARTALFCALMLSLCRAMDYKPYSKEATIAFIAAYLVSTDVSRMFMTGSNAFLITLGVLEDKGIALSWGEYFWHNGVPAFFYLFAGLFLLLFMFKSDNTASSKEYIQEQYRQLGKMNIVEKKTIVLVGIILVLLFTDSIHGIQAGFVFLMMSVVAFLPGFNLADKTLMKNIDFSMVFLVVGTVAIGNVSTEIGAGNMVVNALLGIIPTGVVGLNITLYSVAFLVNKIFTPLAAVAALMSPVIDLCLSLGYNPLAFAYMFHLGTGNIIFPHEVINALVVFGFGMVSMKDFMKYFAAKSVLALICLLVIFLPWYKFVGLI